jgi:hypothetical protein
VIADFSQVISAAIALGAWLAAIAVINMKRLPRLAGRVALTVAIVLYPSVSATSATLVNCSRVYLSATGAAALDGGAAATAAAISAKSSVVVSVLDSNPYFVCWAGGGSHLAAGILAAIALALYVCTLPMLTLWWTWQSAHKDLRMTCAVLLRLCACLVGCRTQRDATRKVITAVGNPLHGQQGDEPHQRTRARHSSPDSGGGGEGAMEGADPALAPLLADYEQHGWYSKTIDLVLLLLLSLLRALLPRPASLAVVAVKAVVAGSALLAVAALVLVTRPYLRTDAWKRWVRALLLLDSAGCVALNACAAAIDLGAGGSGLVHAFSVGAWVLLCACVVTMAVLFVGFARAMYTGAWGGW